MLLLWTPYAERDCEMGWLSLCTVSKTFCHHYLELHELSLRAMEGSKEKQRGEKMKGIGLKKPPESRRVLYLHQDRASWTARALPLSSHRNPQWHLKTGCPLCTVSSLALVALPTQPPNGGKCHVMWNISLTSAPDWEYWAFTQEQSRQWRFHILAQRTWRRHVPWCLPNSHDNKHHHPGTSTGFPTVTGKCPGVYNQNTLSSIHVTNGNVCYLNTYNWSLYIYFANRLSKQNRKIL